VSPSSSLKLRLIATLHKRKILPILSDLYINVHLNYCIVARMMASRVKKSEGFQSVYVKLESVSSALISGTLDLSPLSKIYHPKPQSSATIL